MSRYFLKILFLLNPGIVVKTLHIFKIQSILERQLQTIIKNYE